MQAARNLNLIRKSIQKVRALNHPIRMDIARILNQYGELTVTEIQNILGLQQGVTSQYLRIMREGEIVIKITDGKYRLYSLNFDEVARVAKAIKGINTVAA